MQKGPFLWGAISKITAASRFDGKTPVGSDDLWEPEWSAKHERRVLVGGNFRWTIVRWEVGIEP